MLEKKRKVKIAPDEVLKKKKKKESEDRDKGEDKQVRYAKAKGCRYMCLQV